MNSESGMHEVGIDGRLKLERGMWTKEKISKATDTSNQFI
jgi:hypothetical protein